MSEPLFDQVSRLLATPMPRRRVLRLLGSTLATATFAGLRPGAARAECFCGGGLKCCGNGGDQCCDPSWPCCPKAGTPGFAACCAPDEQCCGGCAPSSWTCCPPAAGYPFPCEPGEQCCGTDTLGPLCCAPGSFCCPGGGNCAPDGWHCCPTPGWSCPPGERCCGPPDECCPFECPSGRHCGDDCCEAGEVCDTCTHTCVSCTQCSPEGPCASGTVSHNTYRGTLLCYLQYKNTTGVQCSSGVFEPGKEGCTTINYFRVGYTVNQVSKPFKAGKEWCVSAPVDAEYDFSWRTTLLDWEPDPSPCCSAPCMSEIARWKNELDRHEQTHVADAQAVRVAANNKWTNNVVTLCAPKRKGARVAALQAEAERQTFNYVFTMFNQLERCGDALDNCDPTPPDLVGICGSVTCSPIADPAAAKCQPGGPGKTCCDDGHCSDTCCP
jgi:hypothetical protein